MGQVLGGFGLFNKARVIKLIGFGNSKRTGDGISRQKVQCEGSPETKIK